MSKRILYLCAGRSFYSRNLGRKIAGVAQSWRSLGHEVLHVCGGDLLGEVPISPAALRAYHGKWYRRIGLLAPVVHSISEHKDIQHDKRLLQHVLQQAASFRPDLIWERNARLQQAGLTAARQLGVPYVLEWLDHLIPYSVSWYRSRAVALEERKHREADFIVVVSDYLRQQLAAEGIDRGKIVVAYNAVDPEEFRRKAAARGETRRCLGIDEDEFLAGYLGSYAFYHDSKRLVLAADILRKQGSHKLKILMVGDGLQYPECHKLARRLGLSDSLVIMKPRVPVKEVPGILAALDAAILPGSTDIICPIKVQEYMAAELPTVLPDYPANREVITHGETGLLFTPQDERSLAESLLALAHDPAAAARLGQNARREVQQRFTWEKTWGAALQKILQRIALRLPQKNVAQEGPEQIKDPREDNLVRPTWPGSSRVRASGLRTDEPISGRPDGQEKPPNEGEVTWASARSRPNAVSVRLAEMLRNAICALRIPGRVRLGSRFLRMLFGKRRVLLPMRHGGWMIFDTGNVFEISMYFDAFSEETDNALRFVLRPGDVFVDCGSHVGYYAFSAAQIVGKAGKVIAIDADPYCVSRLRESKEATACENVVVIHTAIAEKPGTITLSVAADHMFSSICDVDRLKWTSKTQSIDVPAARLDEILSSLLPDPSQTVRLVKIDVEGSEIAAIRGAAESLKSQRFDYIYVEMHPIQLATMGLEPQTFHRILHSHGYRQIENRCHTDTFLYASPSVCAG
jgi:FkbM family methyltransferase